jgi:hypothetical protein
MSPDLFNVEQEVWDAQIELTTAADEVPVANELERAEESLAELEQLCSSDLHPLPLVDVLIGRADSARHAVTAVRDG